MELTYTHCAGLDVHKKTVVACCITPGIKGEVNIVTRSFSTITVGLLELSDWLHSQNVQQVAMESTGEYWKPVYNLLESGFEVLVVNAQHMKNVPGRKTDVQDAQWIAELLGHGLLRGSFIPPLPQRDLRDLTRQRTNLVQERAAVVNRLQKTLEWANIKLACVVTDITGVSARQILAAIANGQDNEQVLAELAKASLRNKRQQLEQALTGRVREHHRFLIAQHLIHLDFLKEQIAIFETQITEHIQAQATTQKDSKPPTPSNFLPAAVKILPDNCPLSWEAAVSLLDTIPGVARNTAEVLLAEIGIDMTRFPSAAHLARWARVCPGNNESAGKQFSGRTGQGNNWLRSALIQAANAASRCKNSYLAVVYQRLKARRGRKRAIVAVAHRILTAVFHMLSSGQPYKDLGVNYLNQPQKQHLLKQMRSRLEQLGYKVTLEAQTSVAPT
jgi:transposase